MFAQTFRDFESDTFVTELGYDVALWRRSCGKLLLPTGRIVACDPLAHPGTEAFEVSVAPGAYSIRLVMAQLRDEVRAAYAAVEFAPGEVERWERATVPDADTSLFGADEHGFSVVSSVAAWMDAHTAASLLDYTESLEPDEDDEFARQLSAGLRRGRKRHDVGWARVALPEFGPGNVVAVEAPACSEPYRSYVGYDAAGEIARLVTDLGVLQLRFPSFGSARS